MNIKDWLYALVMVLCTGLTSAAGAATQRYYTVTTAPDAVSKEILRDALSALHQGTPQGADPRPYFHRNFPQIIEQNVAILGAADTAALLDRLTDKEMGDLARLYVAATGDAARGGRLLLVFASRLDAVRLGRVSKFFGHAPTYEAILRIAPEKASEFSRHTDPNYASPSAGAQVLGAGQYLDMTPNEIYLDLRTAPVGALSATAALYETGMILATQVGIAFGAGYSAGTAAAHLIETYSPGLYVAIGATVAGMVDQISLAGSLASQGQLEQATGALFGLDSFSSDAMETFGGDYGAADAWEFFSTGGNAGCGVFCTNTNPN
jgi:hypothetical protein